MSGSGSGGGYSGSSAYDAELIRTNERLRETLNAQMDAYLADLLAVANGIDRDLMRRRLDELRSHLRDVVDVEQLLFGGSVAKHTAVDGISDVDALVVLERQQALSGPPSDLLQAFAQQIRSEGNMREIDSVSYGRLAVTVRFRDGMEIQLLPAVRKGDQVMIASESSRGWRTIAPKEFSRALTEANQRAGGKLLSAIKLFKAINDSLPPQKQLVGYHVEALAVESVRGYSGPLTPRALLINLMDSAATRVLRPIGDRTQQSQYVDEYLGSENSMERQIRHQALLGLSRRAKGATSMSDWRSLFGD